jgi:hypothetical protein
MNKFSEPKLERIGQEPKRGASWGFLFLSCSPGRAEDEVKQEK